MNTFVQNYRAQYPQDTASDEELVLDYGDKYPADQFPADFQADYQRLKSARDVSMSGVGQELSRGFSRGVTGLETTGAGALALGAGAVGADRLQQYFLDTYKRKIGESAQTEAASVPKIEDVNSIESGAQYLAGKAGELVPALGEAAIFAGVGTAAAPGPGTEAGAVAGLVAKQAARSVMRRTLEKGMTAEVRHELEEYAAGKIEGKALSEAASKLVTDASKYNAALTANLANFATMGAGGSYGQLANTPGVSEQAAREWALIAGAGSSFGALIPAQILKGLFGEKIGVEAAKSYVDLYAKQIPKEILTAGGGMGAMEFFNILAEKHADPSKRDEDFTKEEWSRLLNSVAVGVLASAPAVGITALRGVKPESQAAADATPDGTPVPPASTPEAPASPEAPPRPFEPFYSKESLAIAESRRLLEVAQRKAAAQIATQKKREDKNFVPGTPAEEYQDVVSEIRGKEAKTIRQIQELFPKAELSREQARELRRAAWGDVSAKPAAELATEPGPADATLTPLENPGQPAPAMSAQEINATYPAQVSAEQELVMRQVAERDAKRELTDADRTYLQQLPGTVAAKYEMIRSSINTALRASEREAAAKESETPASPVAAAVADLSPEHKAALDVAGIDVEALATPPAPENAVSVPLIVTREMEQSLADLGYSRKQRNQMSPEEAQKVIAQQVGPPADAVKAEARSAALAEPAVKKANPSSPSEPAAEREVQATAAPVTPVPAGKVEPAGTPPSWVDRVANTFRAWRTPNTFDKVKDEFFTDIGRDQNDKSKSKALGVFEMPDGKIAVASIYDNNGRKVSTSKGGASWDKVIRNGAKPIGHIRTEDAQKGVYHEYTRPEWDAIQSQLEGKVSEARQGQSAEVPEAAVGATATASGDYTPEGIKVTETRKYGNSIGQYVPEDVTRKITSEQSDRLHNAVVEVAGGIPESDTARDNVISAFENNKALQVMISEVGGERASELLLHAIDSYEETVKEFEDRGGGNPEQFRFELAKKLGAFDAKASEVRGENGEALSDDVRQSRPAEPGGPGREGNARISDVVIQRLARAGIPVTVESLRPLADGLARSMGSYDRANKAIKWLLTDTTHPSDQALRVLFEEAGHALFDRESPEMSSAILRAMSTLGEHSTAEMGDVLRDIAHAYPEGTKPEIHQEEVLMGLVARKLAKEGFNPVQAHGLAQGIVRLVKEMYFKASMWVQQNLLGRQYDNPDLAQRYFQNRVESFLSGDAQTLSWVNRLGGGKAPFAEQVGWHEPAVGSRALAQTYNTMTGQIDTARLLPESVEAVLLNLRGDEMRYSSPAPAGSAPVRYVAPEVRLNQEIAVNNEVADVRDLIGRASGVTSEAFRKANGLRSTTKIRDVVANEAHSVVATGFNPEQRIAGFGKEENFGPTYRDAAALIEREKAKVGEILVKDKELLPKVTANKEKANRRAEIELDRYKDAQFMGGEIEKGFRALAADDLKKVAQSSRALGVILQQAKNLEGSSDRPIDPAVVGALRRLFTGSELNGQNLFDLMDILANDGAIDFTRPASEIRDTLRQRAEMIPDYEPYQRLTSTTPEGRALLSTAIAYGKLNERTLALLRMRRMSNGTERAELEAKLRDTWKMSREQLDTGIRRVAKGAKLEEVARAAYRRTMGEIVKATKDEENLSRRIAMNEAALPIYQRAIDKIAGKSSIANDSVFGDGMVVRLPKDGAMNPEWENVTVNLNSAKGEVTTPAQLESMALKIADFTTMREAAQKAGDEAALGIDYQTAKRQLNEIVQNIYYDAAQRNTDHTATGLFLSSARKRMEGIGTPGSSLISVMLGKFQSDTSVFRNQADQQFGNKNPRLKRELIGIVNQGRKANDRVSPDWFNKYFKNAILGFMEKVQPTERVIEKDGVITTELGRSPLDISQGFDKLAHWLLQNPNLKGLIQDRMPEFMAKVKEMVPTLYESGQFWRKKIEDAGLLVEDPKLGGKLRKAFNVGLFTFPRKFSETYRNMVHALRQSGWGTNGADESGAYGDFKNAANLFYSDPAALKAMVDKYTAHEIHGETVKNDFIYRLTHTPDESSIETPELDSSKTTRSADPAEVSRAYDEAGGDLVGMAMRLHNRYNGQESTGEYVQSVLMGLAKQFHAADAALRKIEPMSADERVSFEGLVPNAMIDARQFKHWPSEWFDYHEFDRNDNARMAERVSGQINFGRDTERLAKAHRTVKEETDSLVSKLKVVLGQAEAEVPSGKRKLIDAAAEKILERDNSPALAGFKTGKERLQYLRRMSDRKHFVQGLLHDMSAYFDRNNQQEGSLKWGIRLSQMLASLMIEQPSSAISQLATMFDVPVQWGASSTMLGRTARTVALTAKDIAGSLTQALGFKFLQASEYEKRFNDLKLNESDITRRFRDIFTPLEGEEHNPAARTYRIIKDLQSAPLNRAGEGARYTQLRPFAPFHQFVNSANRALTVSLWELAHNYVSKGLRFLETHPGTDKITSETLGLKGLEKDSFDRWSRDVERYGLRYSDMVKGAADRIRSGDRTTLTDKELGRLYSMGLNEISLENNIATMPMAAFNNSVIKFGLPLLGWSYRRAMQLADKRLDVHDKTSLKAVSTALLGLAATGLGGLGLSLAVDEYQERLLGKKRNIRGLNIPQSANDFMALQERLAKIGTFGLWGELANTAVNVGTGQGENRSLSVDQRVVALQSFQSLQRAITSFVNQGGDADYQHVIRPILAGLGGNGMLQYMQLANHAFDLDNSESRVVKRINAQNYLRVVGRDLGMSIRSSSGSYNTPTPVTPWLARMEYAAYANSPDEFKQAYRGALTAAKETGKDDAPDYIKKAFETRHPLRYVFAQVPSEKEYKQVLADLDDRGTEAVTEAVSLFNYYGSHLGITPFAGSKSKAKKPNAVAAAKARALAGAY